MTVKSYIFLFQKINFTDQFYAPPVVMVTAERVNNDSHLSGCNAITAWVEVRNKNRLVDNILYPSLVGVFFEVLQNHTSSIIVFSKGKYMNKLFTRKHNMKIRQAVRHQIL